MLPSLSLSSLSPFLFHIILSLSTFFLHYFLNLPSLFLHGLHTYIHPDSVPSNDSLRAAIRRPSDPSSPNPNPNPNPKSKPKSKSKSNPNSSQFDESKSQLFRLRLADSLLGSRHSFPSYRLAFLLSILSLSNLSLSNLSPTTHSSPVFSTVLSLPIAAILVVILLSLSSEKSASKRSQKHLSLLAALLGFVTVFLALTTDFFDLLDFDVGCAKAATAALAGLLAGSIFIPASRAARSFWLGTDQLRWSLAVVSCPTHQRVLLYVAALANVAAPMLWVGPVAAAAAEFKEYRVRLLAGCAVLQVLAVRPNLQMYLNEAVLSWYQRLHSGRVPDLDYGRAKVFLHNHYLCLAAAQFFAPPALVLVLLGLSQMEGSLFGGLAVLGGLAEWSDVVKVVALFLGWWIVFVWGVVMISSLALYRTGVLFVS